jgi:hypothetical protein
MWRAGVPDAADPGSEQLHDTNCGSYWRIIRVSRRAVAGRCNNLQRFGNGFDSDAGDAVSSSTNSSDLRPSVQFSPSINEALIEVDFVTWIDASTDPNDITVTLSSNSGGNPGQR